MSKIAFVFSGQGAQAPGMGKELYDCSPAAKAVFDLADSIRPGTSQQCFEGTQEELNVTINTQPCLFACDPAEAEQAQKEIETLGVKCVMYVCDVSSFEASKEVVEKVIEEFGGVDILVNNAGIVRDKLILSMKEEDFDMVINVNLKGAFNMIKHTYSHFMKKRRGRIISISSIVGLNGNAGQANYSSSKAGLIGLTKSTAKELGGRNITVNAIAPGFIDTDMTQQLSDKVKDAMKAQIPMKRPGTPEDIANLALFLASDEASYITGEVIRVDGGYAM